MTYRLLALDIDGTLLDPYGKLVPSVRDAVAAARRRGLWVVLCTGRRFRTAVPWARELGLTGAIVVNNGVLVKDIESATTLHEAYLPPAAFSEVFPFLRRRCSPLVYVDTYHADVDVLTERGSEDTVHEFQREYMDDNRHFLQAVDDLGRLARSDVIMVSTMADEATLGSLHDEARSAFGDRVRTHTLGNKNYRGGILEFLSPASGKWTALARVAAAAGISAAEIIAVGDDTNDIDMIREAGFGVAMGNAGEDVKAVANAVVRSHAEGGAVEAIERALLLT